jgi:polyketide biosynthesis enoyl-CoA hydratase PksH
VELTSTAAVRLPLDLSGASLRSLTHDLERAFASPAAVVTLIGADADTFCLGLAVGAGTDDSTPTHAFADLLTAMHDAPKPVMAVVDGRAIGGGMGLACACDYVVATERATFGLPELLWGLVPAIIWPVLTDRMAPHAVRQWTISAYSRGATEAHAVGLVDELVPAASLERAVQRTAHHLCRLDRDALRRLRWWARESRRHDLPGALKMGADITARMLHEPGVRQRWNAFVAGEAPWSS